MNLESYNIAKTFAKHYLSRKRGKLVCDVGSFDVNGTFRDIFHKHKYVGIDISQGKNVDVVVDPYSYPFRSQTFDAVISGAAIEHIPDMFSWIKEVARIIKIGGLICILAPSRFDFYHKHPVDCWRIYPDGMMYLLRDVAGLDIIKIRAVRMRHKVITCVGIARKVNENIGSYSSIE